jgi:succinate-semialdehyde dehydrogenase/glutarate-semialdehyde dehydrogenase
MKSINPATGELVAEYQEHQPEEVDRFVEIADQMFREWRETEFAARATVLARAGDLLEERADELAVLMAREMGKPIAEGKAEALKSAWGCRHYAEHAEAYVQDVVIESAASKSYVAYEPLGVILAVMPWNFPLWQVFRFAAPALMAGNAGLVKHASNVSGCALAIEDILLIAGVPQGLFRTLLIPSSRVEPVIAHPLVRAATLTGSGLAGAAVAATAGSYLKKTVLELGGSDPYLVLADADLDLAATTCATSRLLNGGQSCIAAKRFIVDESIGEAFTDKLVAGMASKKVGDPLDPKTDIGPQARVDLRDELHQQVADSVASGARVALGGEIPPGPGAYYPATVLTRVTTGMPAYHEEMFGPVAAVIVVGSEREAIAVANDSDFGLGAAVFSRDLDRAEAVAKRIEAGNVAINGLVASDPRLPFGGIKQSGYGRELADLGIKEFMNAKTVVIA